VTQLKKFIEQGAYGEKSGRLCYVFKPSVLPAAGEGMSWHQVQVFNAESDLQATTLNRILKVVVEKGYALITPAARGD
jgi:hypothetical protein